MTSEEIRAFLDRFSRAWESQDVTALGASYAATARQLGVPRAKPA